MKLIHYALISLLLLFAACQSDDDRFPVSMVFGEWVDQKDLESIVLSHDYTYSNTEVTKYGYSTRSGDWKYHNEQIVFVTQNPRQLGLHFPGDTTFVKPLSISTPSNVAKVLTAKKNKLTLQYFLQYPYPKGTPIEDTTIIYTRKE